MYPYYFCSTLLLTGHLCHISTAQTARVPVSRTTIGSHLTTSSESMHFDAEPPPVRGLSPSPFSQKNVTESKSDKKILSVAVKPEPMHRTTSETPAATTLTDTIGKSSWAVTPPGNTNTANHSSARAMPTTARTRPQAVTASHATRSVLTTAARKSAAAPTSLSNSTGMVPTPAPENSLAMIAFGVMSFVLALIVVMVILLTAVNMKGRCQKNKGEGKKICDSLVSEGNVPITGRKESITLVSVKMINAETDIDTPLIPSANSTLQDSEEMLKVLLNSKV
ncbi:endothelial cell-specific chemotaxis regulator [Brienomyrus brachyistius]|uniref:endothelial cell-specific chemotaxis regulator n=1 Tax=Brienomyrus brachyistius TaxID=42636 RepID=UPI0020B450B2|nr:endothelial cell-specific chemotaxis regulator [Brienomyrus brachyistius]